MTNYRLKGYKVSTMGNITCLTALLITLLARGTSQQRVTCDAGQFKVGQNASVTCNFNHSVENTGHQISVMHYPFNASDRFSEKRILRCLRSNDLQPICEVAEGVQWNGNITDRLTLDIPDVTADFGGHYLCQLMPPDGMIMTVCSLTVEETPAQNSSIARSGSWTAFIIVTSTFFSLVAIPALILCIYIIWRRRCGRDDEKQSIGLGCPLKCRTCQSTDPSPEDIQLNPAP
ncbi:uncharacterized protein [Littorina saxatilis]|uniref:uncharacterized protein isoform X2 n=1 Tax=Littorina saxatilis TaxID=31220 RepID=UPI0038B50682